MSIFKLKSQNPVTWLMLLAIVLIPATKVFADFSPSRPTFTIASPATYVTFNSITDNQYGNGDERTFLHAKDVNASAYSDSNVVTDNEELILSVYYHNNAASSLNLIAHNTRVRFALPTGAGSAQQVIAYISADNANPGTVTDTTNFTSPNTQPFTLEYEAGTAKIRNNSLNDVSLSDSIVTSSGAQIGYTSINGDIPGCLGYSGWITIKVRVHVQQPAPEPFYSCDLLNVTALPNRRVDTSVLYTAINGATLNSVSIDWGDLTAPSVSTTSTTASHTYQKDGMYGILATLNFNVSGAIQTDYCWALTTITTPGAPTPPATPPPTPPPAAHVTPPVTKAVATPGKATTLPNTGPGSIAGLFAGVSAFAGSVHYFVTRKFRN